MVRGAAILAVLLAACGGSGEKKAEPEKQPQAKAAQGPDAKALLERAKGMFAPLPDYVEKEPGERPSKELVDLGRMLYFDTRLSKNGNISCNSCHVLARYGVDGQPTSPGTDGVRGPRNSPTVYNAALHDAQFWDARARDVEEQAKGPVLNPIEHGMKDEAAVVAKLEAIPGYVDAFEAAFPGEDDPVTFDHFAEAVGAFERGLLTPSPWDRFLQGDLTALTTQQLEGLQLFMDVGCGSCHSGPAMGGRGLFKLGQVRPYETKDRGRAEVTGNDADAYLFKPPGLRNVTKTGPYFHDGSVTSLDEAVRLMGAHQLGKDLTADEIKRIVAFLDALTGELPNDWIAEPKLPGAAAAEPTGKAKARKMIKGPAKLKKGGDLKPVLREAIRKKKAKGGH